MIDKLKPSIDPNAIVLGAGIVGITLALQLQLRGRRVLLIDRQPPGTATSFGNAGLIERSSVFPYAFPRDWRTLIDYALQRKAAAHYHAGALLAALLTATLPVRHRRRTTTDRTQLA